MKVRHYNGRRLQNELNLEQSSFVPILEGREKNTLAIGVIVMQKNLSLVLIRKKLKNCDFTAGLLQVVFRRKRVSEFSELSLQGSAR